MKFRRKTKQEIIDDRISYIKAWNKKFAWWPVRLAADEREIRWLEFVHRRGTVSWKTNRFTGNRDRPFGIDWRYADSGDLLVKKLKDEDDH